MEDVYIVRDEKRVMALRGHRTGQDRRRVGPAPRIVQYGSKILKNRRGRPERRHKTVLSFRDRFFERLSCLTNGIALLAVALFFILTGLTFLPIVGVLVGVYILIQSFIVMAEVVHKVE